MELLPILRDAVGSVQEGVDDTHFVFLRAFAFVIETLSGVGLLDVHAGIVFVVWGLYEYVKKWKLVDFLSRASTDQKAS